jgi:hypothetical protein
MGFDCGFDVYPPLERAKANQEQYDNFPVTSRQIDDITIE